MLWNGLPLVGAVAALIVGVTHGLGTSLLVVAATVLWVSVSFLWTSLQLLAGESSQGLEGSLAVDGPAAEEEQKRFLLQALKDLEFERSMGKIDDKDYEDLTHFYRNQAKSVLRALDDKVGPAREKAEVLIQKALEKEGLVALEETDKTDHPPPTESTPERLPCSECGTENDPDAAFCKRCGHAVDETEEEQGL